ncbi:phospholipase C/P1 nuclease [Hysterangium stoloniferum]|nr:phospholipase C/P1 nuclease [Hysterangium stoloniferum]
MRIIHLLPLASLSCYVPQVVAYGAVGHEIVGTIAQMYLFDSTVAALSTILPADAKNHLAAVATWADQIKYRMRWSSKLHYVNGIGDHPGNLCVFGEQGWEGKENINVLGGIRNTTDWLRDGKDGEEEALKFLVHFLGDLHMPLHLTGRNKGGNSDKVKWSGRSAKFHAVWDSLIIAKQVRITPSRYDSPLPNEHVESALRDTIYDPYVRQIVDNILTNWTSEVVSWSECPADLSTSTSTPIAYHNSDQIPLDANADTDTSPNANANINTNTNTNSTNSTNGLPIPQTDDAVACPFYWAKPIHALNCEVVWPPSMDSDDHPAVELDTPEYAGVLERDLVVQKLLGMGGVRLAAILNTLYADEEEVRVMGRGGNLNLAAMQ